MTLPGNSARATTVSACTTSPTFTRTVPGNGQDTSTANGGPFGDGESWCIGMRHNRLLKTPCSVVLSCSFPSPYYSQHDSGRSRLAARGFEQPP